MAVKHYIDELPPSTGRVYRIETDGGKSKITDVTEYEQRGSNFGAGDINMVCVLECHYLYEAYRYNHALSTENTESENIKFFATADFKKGDTFTFNGEKVTARTIDGRALDTNFFKANSLVECRKRNDTLYFMGSGRSIADDSTGVSYRLGIENGIMYIEEE